MGGTEHVKRVLCLWSELVPQLKRAIWVDCAQSCNEMVLESGDSTLGGIDSVIVWRNQLDDNIFTGDALFYCFGALVVHMTLSVGV